ncbi:transposon Tf2-6 polyprotein, partial [Elysia marginata]
MCAARQQRYAVFLSGFDYSIEYRNSNANADSLSRLPLPTNQDNNELKDDTCMYYQDIVESIP